MKTLILVAVFAIAFATLTGIASYSVYQITITQMAALHTLDVTR